MPKERLRNPTCCICGLALLRKPKEHQGRFHERKTCGAGTACHYAYLKQLANDGMHKAQEIETQAKRMRNTAWLRMPPARIVAQLAELGEVERARALRGYLGG